MENYSIQEIVEMAVQTERLGFKFYNDMAEKFKSDAKLNNLFSILAVKEQRHQKAFEELKEILGTREPEHWEEVQSYFRAVVESEFFLGKDKSLPSMDHLKTVADAVRFAMGFEKETLLYFVMLRDQIREKDVVDEIINEEKSHIMWLGKFKEGLGA